MGRVTKVVLVDKDGGPVVTASVTGASLQEPNDPFSYGSTGLQQPPYNPDGLVQLAERHPIHSAAIEQKSSDIAGTRWEWTKRKADAKDEDRQLLDEWLEGLADPQKDESTAEIIHSAWLDVETVGWGTVELARDSAGVVRKIYSMPAYSTRFHKDGLRIAQGVRRNRKWFKRWMPSDFRVVVSQNGEVLEPEIAGIEPDTVLEHPHTQRRAAPQGFTAGNEVLILRRPSRRTSFYGIPAYVSAMGWIYLSLAARDDNIHFFNNRREPRWAIVLQNLEEDDDLEEAIREAFTVSLDKPHRNVIIPIEGEGTIKFQKMTEDSKDISFDRLQDRADEYVLVSHRIPPDRLGTVRVGPLGGNATMAASRVYKEAVVVTSQGLLAERMNRFIRYEAPSNLRDSGWWWKPVELDITEEAQNVTDATTAWESNMISLDEARAWIKKPPRGGPDGEKYFYQLVPAAAAGAAASGAAARAGARLGASIGAQNAERSVSAQILSRLGPQDASQAD